MQCILSCTRVFADLSSNELRNGVAFVGQLSLRLSTTDADDAATDAVGVAAAATTTTTTANTDAHTPPLVTFVSCHRLDATATNNMFISARKHSETSAAD